jgi:hypothetical protein
MKVIEFKKFGDPSQLKHAERPMPQAVRVRGISETRATWRYAGPRCIT